MVSLLIIKKNPQLPTFHSQNIFLKRNLKKEMKFVFFLNDEMGKKGYIDCNK